VPGAGGNVVGFSDLVASLGDAWPVIGLQPRGLDGSMVPHSTVEAAAESYLRAVQEVRPEGPLHLLGHSFGGWIVFEMARRLIAAGRPVESLTLVDSEPPHAVPGVIHEYSHVEVIMKWVEILEMTLERPLRIRSSDLESRNEAAQRELLHERLVRLEVLPRRSTADALRGLLNTFAAAMRTHYRPDAIYPGAVRLVLVNDAKLDANSNQRQQGSIAGWQRYAPDLVAVQAPGNHITVLKRPHVDSLAPWLRKGVPV
jgi:thioesterase domain-containing protein